MNVPPTPEFPCVNEANVLHRQTVKKEILHLRRKSSNTELLL